ncbi:MAG: serine hydrolase [Bacteroidetes bacterium]|nr:serine hydrolase [Bacteroidota bacterium]MBL0064829.1 serine hydrolase [Bacteroidota bacterium]MBL0137214.1 serine hydrolase [Bacteroidota bacterium]
MRPWSKVLFGFFIIFLSINLAIWITGYTYIYKTLLYTYPDIDDLGIFEARSIESGQKKEWPVSTKYNKDSLPVETRAVLELNESVAFLVIKNDSLLYEEYWDHYEPNSLSNSFSVAKSIVGILVGIAADEGKLNINDPVGKYLPQFNEGKNSALLIHHLLSMSSGLNWDESYSSLFSQTTEAYYGKDLRKQMSVLKVEQEPGKVFNYMSCNTEILALVLEKATGMTVSEYASKKLWTRIQAMHQSYWSLDQSEGMEKAYCCFYADARDFARIGQLMLDSGKWKGTTIVSSSFIREMTTPKNLVDENGASANYYGYQCWLSEISGHPVFYARGILGQYIVVVPDQRMVIVRLGKKRGEKVPPNQYSDMIVYVEGALKAFGN